MNAKHLALAALFILAMAHGLRAEDFSVHLDDIAKVDKNRPVPAFTIEKALDEEASKGRDEPGMPTKVYQIYMNIDGFGRLALDTNEVAGPAEKGSSYTEGRIESYGLVPEVEQLPVVAGWLEGAPDLLVLGWTGCPDMRGSGSGLTFSHSTLLVRLADGKATPLFRRCASYAIRSGQNSYDCAAGSFHYEYDADARVFFAAASIFFPPALALTLRAVLTPVSSRDSSSLP